MAKKIAQLEARLEELAEQNKALTAENKLLHQKVQHLLGRIFGRKTEQLDPAQLQLLMGIDADTEDQNDDDDDPPPSPPSPGRKKRRKSKPRIPEDIPTENIKIDPD